MLRIPHCLDSWLTDGGKVVRPMHRLQFTPHFMILVLISVRDGVNPRPRAAGRIR
jgi:hypothetical protein